MPVGRYATTEFHGTTEYDVVRVGLLRWYYSDDEGRRFHAPFRFIARLRAFAANREDN